MLNVLRKADYFVIIDISLFCFEHILLNKSKGSETSSRNLLVPLLIYNNMSCKL